MAGKVPRSGVLLINLGTPESAAVAEVGKFLHAMLSDPRIMDIPAFFRFILVNLIIVPFRSFNSAEAYQKVWTTEGSPLTLHSRALAMELRKSLGNDIVVEEGMRYGEPSIENGLNKLASAGVDRLFVLPLYPQYSSAATGSALERVHLALAKWPNIPSLVSVAAFFDHPGFIAAWREVAKESLSGFAADHVLFSYHGLPERQVKASDPTGSWCLARPDCCDATAAHQRFCYRFHCLSTTRALAKAIGLDQGAVSTSFQSRLGRTPWLKPYTVDVLPELRRRGVRRLAVLCPAFVSDCLETLEEIGIRGKEQWLSSGGEDFLLVPSLNEHPAWVRAVADLLRDHGL